MSHTISVSGDDWGMKNCDSDAWVFWVLLFLQCCSPIACCLMSDRPPCTTENTRPTHFTICLVDISTDTVQPRMCLLPLMSVLLQPFSLLRTWWSIVVVDIFKRRRFCEQCRCVVSVARQPYAQTHRGPEPGRGSCLNPAVTILLAFVFPLFYFDHYC